MTTPKTNEPDNYSATLNQDGTVDIKDLTPVTGVESGYSAIAAVQAALSQEPLEFENMVKLGLADRLQGAVEKRREEVAQSIFGTENSEVPADDNNAKNDKEDEIEDKTEE